MLGFLGFFKWYMARRDKRKSAASATHYIAEMYRCLNEIVAESGASRAIVLKMTNGGGIPKIGHEIYSTAVYEVFAAHETAITPLWEKQPADVAYVALLSDVLLKGHICIRRSELPRHSILRDVYTSQGTEMAHVYLIHKTRDAVFYLSITFRDVFDDTPDQRNFARAKVASLRNLFRAAYH